MGNVPGMVNTDANGVPLGQTMVPVAGKFTDPRTQVSVGVMTHGPYDPNGVAGGMGPVGRYVLPTDQAVGAPSLAKPIGAQGIDFGGATVLQATPEEKATLLRMRAFPNDPTQLAPGLRGPGGVLARQQLYDLGGNRMANDENARQIALQGERNKGVMATVQNKKDIAEIGANGKVDVAKINAGAKFDVANMTGDLQKDKQALAERHQSWLEEHGEKTAHDLAIEHYAADRAAMVKGGATPDQMKYLDTLYGEYVEQQKVGKTQQPVAKTVVKPTSNKPAGVPVWQKPGTQAIS